MGAYRARLNANLRFWDGLFDGKADTGVSMNGTHPLTELAVLADYLVVDVTKPLNAASGSYLEIERALIGRSTALDRMWRPGVERWR